MPAIDLLEELRARIVDRANAEGGRLTDAAAAEEVDRLREEYGGDRYYIGKTSADSLRSMGERNRALYRDHKKGMHVPALMRKYKIRSRTTVWKIIREYRPSIDASAFTDLP